MKSCPIISKRKEIRRANIEIQSQEDVGKIC